MELNAAVARSLGPAEPAGMPLDEGFGFRRDEQVLVETGVLLADLGVAALDDQPVPFVANATREVEADDDAPLRELVTAERPAH
jgi:hypothetical protein